MGESKRNLPSVARCQCQSVIEQSIEYREKGEAVQKKKRPRQGEANKAQHQELVRYLVGQGTGLSGLRSEKYPTSDPARYRRVASRACCTGGHAQKNGSAEGVFEESAKRTGPAERICEGEERVQRVGTA
jgi:hypothetical protein